MVGSWMTSFVPERRWACGSSLRRLRLAMRLAPQPIPGRRYRGRGEQTEQGGGCECDEAEDGRNQRSVNPPDAAAYIEVLAPPIRELAHLQPADQDRDHEGEHQGG